MSYLRYGSVFKFVDGISKDYVFPSEYKKGKKLIPYIEDYGEMSNEAIIEIMLGYFEAKDNLSPELNEVLKQHILKRLAENLKIKLRQKPLTLKQEIELTIKEHNKFKKTKLYKSFFKKLKK